MAEFSTGSLNFSRMIEAAKAGHSAFTKSEKTGEIFCAFKSWKNDQPDQYKNDGSIQLNSTKEKADQEKDLFKKGYLGNFKIQKTTSEISQSDKEEIPEPDDLPF